ncbi:proteinase-activated receptor 3 [Rhinophrynus dorsalis]
MKAFQVLFFLFLGALASKVDDKLDNDTSETSNIPKTFRGSANDFELIPQNVIEGLTEATTDKKRSSPSSGKDAIKVNNSTKVYLRSKISTVLIPVLYTAVVIIGVPANAIVLWMLFHHVRSVCTAVFYTSLAISDLLFCLMLPFKIVYHLNGNNWMFGETMCRAMTIFLYGNMYCSILLLTCISISRYVAIVHPFIYRSLPKLTYAVLMCALVWIIVLVYMIPFSITKQTYYLKELNIVTCHDVYDTVGDAFQFYYFISLAVFGFLIPFSIVAFCYFSIIRSLATNNHKRLWYIKITVLFFVIFSVCFTPSNIILIIHQVTYHYRNIDDMYGIYLVALCLSSLNSCLDPFLYFLLSKKMSPTNNYDTITKLPNETHTKLLSS